VCQKVLLLGFPTFGGAYGSLRNHVHEMYVVPTDVTIADILQAVKGHFSLKYNKKYGRSGHFWRNKPFYRIVQDEEYVLTSCHYYHMNPRNAGMVTQPEDWPFSGYRFHYFGERTGIIGKLLDPVPNFTAHDWQALTDVQCKNSAAQLRRPRSRFIGSDAYRRQMKRRYGKQKLPTQRIK
jgi:hypothetical protein